MPVKFDTVHPPYWCAQVFVVLKVSLVSPDVLVFQVMGRDVHIDENGDVMVPDQSAYIWFDKGIDAETGKVPLVDLLPKITLPLSSDILSRLVSLLRVATKHNFVSSLLVVAGGIMSLHYSTITNQFGGCPIVVARGPAETGKSTALRSAFSILGMMTLL